jgi:hypothetical protein
MARGKPYFCLANFCNQNLLSSEKMTDRYKDGELWELENRINRLDLPASVKTDTIALLVAEEIKREVYHNKDRMDSYRFWDEIQNHIFEKRADLERRLQQLRDKK